MIKSVLLAVPIYYMSCFRLSSKATNDLDGLLKKFLWEGSKDKKKIPSINWEMTCLIKDEGGVGLRKMNLHNLALGTKLAWKMYMHPQKIWCKILSKKYLDSPNSERIFTLENSDGGSPIWRFIWESRRIIIEHLSWKIDNGKKARFWRDSWNGDPPLAEAFEDQDWLNQVEASVGPFAADYM